MNTRHAFPLFLALISAACSGGNHTTRSNSTTATTTTATTATTATNSSPGGDYSAPAAADAPMAEAESSAPAPASRSSSAADSAPARHHDSGQAQGAYQPQREAPRPKERPGLGTVFGETVNSHARMKPFVRSASSPFAAVALHYNDAEGVRAHMGYVGQNQLSPFNAHTPHGGISIALTDIHGNMLLGGVARGRSMIVGAEGQRYNIVLHNQTGGRYEVVASVDGLDVIDGRPADLAKRGYILEPHSSLTIDGFRRSEYQVAAFRFGRVSQSYAARTSGDRNVGVIGAAFFAEKGSVWTTDELHRRDTANPFPGDRSYARPPSH